MQSKTKQFYRYALFLIGVVFYILPTFNTENDILYVISPWIYITSFLYYTRTIERKREWGIFSFVFLTAHEFRYSGFLGDTAAYFDFISMLLIILIAAATIIPYFVDLFYLKRGNGFLKVFAFPFTRVLAERIIVGQQFNLSLSQFGNKYLLQTVSIFGDVIISFMVTFIPSVIVYMIVKKDNKKMVRYGCIALTVFALLMGYGAARYHLSGRAADRIRMAYATGPRKTYYEEPSEVDPTYDESLEYMKRTATEAAANGAELIAYAEEAFIIDNDEKQSFLDEVSKVARENNIFMLVCLDIDGGEDMFYNTAVFIDNKGEFLSDYTKYYLIPVIETSEYVGGKGEIPSNHVIIGGKEHVISYSICYDATYTSYLASMDKKTDIYINPSWDWEEIDDLNYRMQGMSAVAAGVELFKPTVDGWSMVTNPYGRVTYKESTLRGDYDKVYYAEVSPCRTFTLYKFHTPLFLVIWTLLVGFMLFDMCRIMIKSIKAMRKKKAEAKAEAKTE